MLFTREMLIKRLAEESGFFQRDIRMVLHCLDDVVLDCFNKVTDDEDVSVQIIKGIKCGCKVVAPRDRVDPRTQEAIVVSNTIKPFTKFSQDFRLKIQEQYEEKKNEK